MDTVKGAYINKRGNVVFCPIGAESTFPDFASRVYASAPPSPASVQDEALVEKLAKRTCEANADSARFTIALQTLRASLDPDDWMGAVTMHNYIDAVLAGGSPLQQHPAPSPAQAVDAVGEPWVVFDSQGYYAWHSTEVSAKEWCEHYNARSADDPLKPYVCRRISECAALQASRQPQAQQAVAEGAGDGLRQTLIDVGRVIAWQCFGDCRAYDEFGPGSLRGLHEMDAEIRAALATPQPEPEWSPAYTRGPARQSAPVTAVPALVPLSVLQYNQIPELCQIRPSLYESVVRAIEAAIAKINGLTVGDGAQPIKDTP